MRHIICFHNPEEENGYLSNWYPSPFEKDGISFAHMEQYMMYQKALQFQDTEIAQQILQTDNPGKVKALGRERPELCGLPVECSPAADRLRGAAGKIPAKPVASARTAGNCTASAGRMCGT